MFRRSLVTCVSLASAAWLAAAADVPADVPPPQSKFSAVEIVEKNVAARGGLEAWRNVKTMSLSGKLGAGGNQRSTLPVPAPGPKGAARPTLPQRPAEEVQLPFLMELQRPRKMRFELQFNGQTALQVYDGANGWKLRPFLNRRVVEPYTEEETKTASMQADLDGPLVDYAAKGTKVELAGMEKVENRDQYKLKLTMKNGEAIHVWIDAQTFLETKIQGTPRKMDGVLHPVEVYFRDYRAVNGLQVPFILETKVLPTGKPVMGMREPQVPAEKTIIEKVVVNPKFEDSLFTKPEVNATSASNLK